MKSNIAQPEESTGCFKFDSKPDMAEMIGVSERSISNYMKLGMPHVRIGRSVRFDRVLVREWLNRRCGKGGV